MKEGTTDILREGVGRLGQVRCDELGLSQVGGSVRQSKASLKVKDRWSRVVGGCSNRFRYPDLMDRTLARDCGTDG